MINASDFGYWGALMAGFGVVLELWRRKRKFDRTNEYGVERFPSYWKKLTTRVKDGVLALGALAFFGGGMLMLGFQYQDSWGWIVLLPASIFVLFMMLLS